MNKNENKTTGPKPPFQFNHFFIRRRRDPDCRRQHRGHRDRVSRQPKDPEVVGHRSSFRTHSPPLRRSVVQKRRRSRFERL